MSLVWLALIGVAVAVVARGLSPTAIPAGTALTLALGAAGAVIAGLIADHVTRAHGAGGLIVILASVVGAALLLYGYRFADARLGGGTRPY